MTVRANNKSRRREHADPHERNVPLPWFMLVLVAVAFAWAVGYIVVTQRDDPPVLGDLRTLAALGGKAGSGQGPADGAQVYAARCIGCHQASGMGLAGVFPPLAGSEWVLGPDRLPASILLFGISGTLTVKGGRYNGAMPAFGGTLSDDEIAAVISHVRRSFGNAAPAVSVDAVKAARAANSARATPWKGDDELAPLKP